MANKIEFSVLVSGSEQISRQFSSLSDSLEAFSKTTKSLARDLSQVGQTVSLFGASISGPLVLAFNNAAKSSAEAAAQTKRFQDVTQAFNREIASSVVPVFSRLNDVLGNLFESFQKIDKSVRDQILQGALLAGAFITVGGAITIVVAKVIALASNMASLAASALLGVKALIGIVTANPAILGVALAIGALVYMMFKFKEVGDAVMNTFEIMFIFLKNGFLTIGAFVKGFVAASFQSLSLLVNAVASIQSPLQEQYRALGVLLENNATLARRLAFNDLAAVNENAGKIGEIIQTGQGQFSESFNKMKEDVMGLGDLLLGIFGGGDASGTEGGSTLFSGFMSGLEQIGIKLADLKTQGAQFAQTLHSGMATAFSDIIMGAKSAGEAFKAFGQAMLKAIVDFIAQWLAFQVLSKALALVGVTFAVAQAAIVAAAWAPAAALASLATLGSNSVPASAALTGTVGLANTLAVPKFAQGSGGLKDDTLGMFNKREIIVPTTFSDAIRSGDLSLSGGGNGGGAGLTVDLRGSTFNGITDKLVEDIFTKASENIKNRTLAFGGA